MRLTRRLLIGAALQLAAGAHAVATEVSSPYVRVAELEIDPAGIERFNASAKEEIAESVRVEPGVVALYAVALKQQPTQIRVFEVYVDEAAYRAHLETPHFKKFRADTEKIVTSRRLMDAVPIILGTK